MAKKKVTKKKVTKKTDKQELCLSDSQMLLLERSLSGIDSNRREASSLKDKIEMIRLKANSEIMDKTLKLNALVEISKNLKEKHEKAIAKIKKDLGLLGEMPLRYDSETGEIDHE